MLVTAITIISGLVAVNFLLLHFSCNKTKKSSTRDKKPIVLSTKDYESGVAKPLAPTGS